VRGVAQREVALAGIALLALVVAFALAAGRDEEAQPVSDDGVGEWRVALAAPYRADGRERTACGQRFTATAQGVAHPVLPCGAKIVIRFDGKPPVLTQVIDRGPEAPGREFDITQGLADELDLSGTQRVEWRFAG
jgi:rare lipoprotein A (peptidoglycan hydrolase)